MPSTASFTKIPWGRASSLQRERVAKNKESEDAETLSVGAWSAPMPSTGVNDVDIRDDATNPALDDSESRTGDDGSSLGFSFSVSSGLSTKDSEVDIESKTSASEAADLAESTAILQTKTKTLGKPPLPPPTGLRRTLSNASGFRKALKKSVPAFLTRSRSIPVKPEETEDTLSVAKASLVRSVSVDADADGIETVEDASIPSVEDTLDTNEELPVDTVTSVPSVSSEVEDDTDADTVTSVPTEASEVEDDTVATSVKDISTKSSEVENDTIAGTIASNDVSASEVEDENFVSSVKSAGSKDYMTEEETIAGTVKSAGSKDSMAEEETIASTVKSASSKDSMAEEETIASTVKSAGSKVSMAEEEASTVKSASSKVSMAEEETIASTVKSAASKASMMEEETIASTVKTAGSKVSAVEDDTIGGSKVSDVGDHPVASTSKEVSSEPQAKVEDESVIGVVTSVSSVSDSKTTLGSVSQEIQDPWPNPWSDVGVRDSLATSHHEAFNPHSAHPAKVPESVLSKSIGVVAASSSVDRASNVPSSFQSAGVNDGLAEDPASVKSYSNIPDKSENDQQHVFQSKSDLLIRPQLSIEAVETSLSMGNGAVIKSETVDLKEWKNVMAAESGDVSTTEAPAETTEVPAETASSDTKITTKAKVKTLPPFWKRARQSRKSKEMGTEKPKTSKAKKFNLGYLCLLSPCTKKQSSIEETAPAEEKNLQRDLQSQQGLAVSADQAESVSYGDLTEGDASSHKYTLLEMIHIDESRDDLIGDQATAVSNTQPVSGGPTDLEETKEDLMLLDTAASSRHVSRSWLSDFPTQESMIDGHDKTLSYISSFGEISGADSEAAPNAMSNLKFYINAATQAVQHNLYDVPVREFEKLRDFTCHSGGQTKAEPTSQLDKGVTATDNLGSIYYGKDTKKATEVRQTRKSNPFAVVFKELVDVLECGSGRTTTQSPLKNKFEEEKLEIMGSASLATCSVPI